MPSGMGGPNAGRSSGTDLVAELRHQHAAQIQQGQRDRSARRRSTIVKTIVAVVVVAALAVAAWIGFNKYRVSSAMSSARAHLEVGTADELALAAESIDKALAVSPSDEESQGVRALIRAHQAVLGQESEALATALEAVSDSDEPEAQLAAGIAAALAGDLEKVQSVLEKVEPSSESKPIARARAWLHGTVALGKVFDRDQVTEAITELEGVIEGEAWTPPHRWLAALLSRVGRVDDALSRLETARTNNPADLGIAVDEALIHGVLAEHTGGVREVADRLLADENLQDRDRGRLHLARALVSLRKDGFDKVGKELDEAWKHLPEWDVDSRAIVIETALVAGDVERGEKWLDKVDADETTKKAYGAWIDLQRGKVAQSLETSAELDQAHPRVAYVQALALVEQKRFKEAGPWLERAQAFYGPRVELRVAQARRDAHTGDPKKAAKALADIVKDNHTRRGLTGLGEAELLAAGEEGKTKDAEKALRKAIDKEDKPAEAAFLLGSLLEEQAKKDPKKIPDAIELLRKAAEIDEGSLRYRVELGQLLADHGDLEEAQKVLATLDDEELVPGKALLALANVMLERVELGHEAFDEAKVTKTLTAAANKGADPLGVALAQARVMLASGDAKLTTAVNTLYSLLSANPTNMKARLLYGEALRRNKDYTNARLVLKDGQGDGPYDEGRLQIARAAVERSDGSDRLAASIAWKGWLALTKADMPGNERLRLAREAAQYWEEIDNHQVPRSISSSIEDELPWRADALAFRALTQLADDKNEEGCDNAKKAMKLDKELGEAHAAEAECFISKHRYTDARASYTKAIELALSENEARTYKRRLRVLR